MAFLQSFTYMKTNLDIFTDYIIYKGKLTVPIGEMGSVPKNIR